MTETRGDEQRRRDGLPEPGREAAAGVTAQGMDDAEVAGRTVRRLERSGAGPAAGEEDVVVVETPLQAAGDEEVTRHPTLRGSARTTQS